MVMISSIPEGLIALSRSPIRPSEGCLPPGGSGGKAEPWHTSSRRNRGSRFRPTGRTIGRGPDVYLHQIWFTLLDTNSCSPGIISMMTMGEV